MRTLLHCPACDSVAATNVVTLDAENRVRFLAFSQRKYGGLLDGWIDEIPPVIARCVDCGHCWYRHQPEPAQLRLMYAAGRPLGNGAPPTREPTPAMIAEMTRLRRLVDPAVKAPPMLDYGSGYGRWARAAVRAGFTVTAFEPSAERGSEERQPFELVHSSAALGDRRFAAIQLEQVLEHVPDPLTTLQSLRVHCEADTVLRITVPNILRAAEGKNIWSLWPFDGHSPHVLAPFEHLHGFTPSSLAILIMRSGYEVLPLGKIWHNYPELVIRNLVGKVYSKAGKTMMLAKLTKINLQK